MDISIPSRGRAHIQESVRHLSEAGLEVRLVVPTAELPNYMPHTRLPGVTVVGCPVDGIANTRQWIVDNGTDQAVCMVDDDLVFYKRRVDEPTKLTQITPAELKTAFLELERTLLGTTVPDCCAHAGFAAREGANRNVTRRVYNTRILRVLAYRRDVLVREQITFGRMQVMEDFDVALRLLRAGYTNSVLNTVAHNQKGSGSEGGCSTYRTPEIQAAAAHRLAALHPGFVRVTTKTTKTAWGGGTRTDVQISWKAAYASAQN